MTRSPWEGHGAVRAKGAAGCQRHQSLAQSGQLGRVWQCPAIEPCQIVAQSTSRRHAPRPSALHGGGARVSLRGPKLSTFQLCPKDGVRLSELSECTLVMPEAYENIPGCSHHLWGKFEKNEHFGLGGWLGHHHRGVLMAGAHGVWKCSEPLFGQVQWLGIAN